jgi:hypothetical protein
MGLSTKIKAETNQQNNLITVTDITSVYNATTNPDGYGSPNRGNSNDIVEFTITKPDGTTVSFTYNGVLTDPAAPAVPVLMPANALSKVFTALQLGVTDAIIPLGMYKVEYRTWYRLAGTVYVEDEVRTEINHMTTGSFTSETAGFGTSAKWLKLINSITGNTETRGVAEVVSDSSVLADQELSPVLFPPGSVASIYAGYLATTYVKLDAQLQNCYQPKIAALSIEETNCCPTCPTNKSIDTLMDIMMGIEIVDVQFENGLYEEANNNLQTLYKVCQGENCKC